MSSSIQKTEASDGVQVEVEIVNNAGLHTKTSARFVQVAQKFESTVRVSLAERSADGKSVMELLTLGAGKGKRIHLSIHGPDQDEALEALQSLVAKGFSEAGA